MAPVLSLKKLAGFLAFVAISVAQADTAQEEWSSRADKHEPNTVRVGEEVWNSWDESKPLPYRFASGAVLNRTMGDLRLDLCNVTLAKNGILADGDLAVLLTGDNYVSGSIRAESSIAGKYSLLIFGLGSLVVTDPGYQNAISAKDVSFCAGASVTILGDGVGYTPLVATKVLISMSSVSIHAPNSNGISTGTTTGTINIIGSILTINAKSNGVDAYQGTVVIDGSVVNILSPNNRPFANLKTFVCSHSYLSCASGGNYAMNAVEAHFDNSLVKLYSKTSKTLAVDDVTFGEGDYYIASGSSLYAIDAYNVVLSGGNVQICVPGEEAAGVSTRSFTLDSGRMEMVDAIDIREFLKYDAAAAAVFTGTIAAGAIDSTALMANFYSQVIVDAVSNGAIGNLDGNAYAGIQCNQYTQNCGTAWCDLPEFGVLSYGTPIINGGSFKGQFFNRSYSYNQDCRHDVIIPIHVATDGTTSTLKCVPHTITGTKKYDKISRSWDNILPPYYGTGSLYTDENGKLYFWLPETWSESEVVDVPGGDDSGGGPDGAATDLAFYVPEHYGWTSSLIVSSDPFATSSQAVFEQGETVCLNYAFRNAGNGLAVSNFVNRFTLSNGYYWEDSWIGYSLSNHGWGWLGYNIAPGFLNNLPPGDYMLTCALNVNGALPESNVANNTASVSFKVKGPDLAVSSASVSRETITLSESAIFNWRVANIGNAGASKTKTAFMLYDYDSSSGNITLKKTEWLDCEPLAADGKREYTKSILGKSLGVGEYNIAIWTDSKGEVVESNETNNWKFVYIRVVNEIATMSTSGVDWQFKKYNSSDPDSFYLSSDSSLKKKATTFNVGQPIYMRRAFWNAKKKAVDGQVASAYWLNGRCYRSYSESSYVNANEILYNSSTRQDFLQDLPAGSYTLTAVLDSDDSWWEANEKNNVKVISFTVVGKPTICSETTYRCAVNVPVSWPVTMDGKAQVKGLPAGLKYSGGAISGKATKAGTYVATFSTSNVAGSTSKTITIVVEDPGFVVTCSARPNGASSRDVVSDETVDLFVGVKQEFSLSAIPAKTGVENSAVSSMSAKGLPSGLKLSKGVISGVPTKPGSYSANITFKNKYGWTSIFTMKFVVCALPNWATGTFEGGCGTMWEDGAKITYTVSSAGKLSGKVLRQGETWTMTASAYSAYIDGYFVFDPVLKSGKNTIEVRLWGWRLDDDDVGAFYMPVDLWGANIYATRIAWTSGICAEALKRSDVIGTSRTLDGESLSDIVSGEYIKFAFAKNGSLKATANLVAVEKNGKTIYKTKAISASLVPWQVFTADSGETKLVGAKLFLYFPPSSKNSDDGRFFNIDAEFLDGALNLLQSE